MWPSLSRIVAIPHPHVAAAAEAGMLSLFTLLVWGPAILAAPATRLPWTAFFISWAIAASAWILANNIPTKVSDKVGRPIKGNVKRKISPIGSMASHCCQGIQPHCLSGHSYSESDFPQAVRSVWSPRAQRRFFLSPVVPFRCVTAPIIF
jgi:hypothetical protein